MPWLYPDKAEQAAEWVIEHAQLARESFFCVHLLRSADNRQGSNALDQVRALWLDLDGGEYPQEGPQPTARVRTSPGRSHRYFRLTEAIPAKYAEELTRRLCAFAGGDKSKECLSSVLRPAGTANFKPEHGKPELVVGWHTGVPEWEPEVLDQALPELPPEPERGPREPYTGAPVDLLPYLQAVEVLGEVPDSTAKKWKILCPWAGEHTSAVRTGTYLMQFPSGAPHFECKHAHCLGRKWREFKQAVKPRRVTKVGRPGYTGGMEFTIKHG